VTDKFKLEYILNNLVNNALKFTFAGTVIFGFTGVDKNIKFYVSDTGIGIPEEHKSKIFNRFYQAECGTTRRFEGTGLGLSVARAYVELLGGKIWFNSQIGKGTKFWFTVPFVK
jgi:signal transduction histidine kinase